MAISGTKPVGVVPSNPGIALEIEGAPASIPGGGSDKPTTQMSGTPVATATVPPAVSTDVVGAPNAGQSVTNPTVPPTTEVKVSTDVEDKGTEEAKDVPATDTDAPSSATATENNNPDTAGSDRKIKTLQDVIDTLEPPETDEQRKKRERREKSAKIISAVSDGLMAMGNLFFTSQYAPNMYNHEKGSQLNAQNAAIEKARKDREANADKYLRFALALGDAENERAKTAREVEAEQERRKLAREKAQRDAEQHGWLAALQPDKQREQAGKANKAEQEARTAQAEADNAPAMQRAKLETEKARKGSYQASAANSRASAAAHGRSNVAEFIAYDKKGKAHPFRTAAAAEAFARQHGTWHEDEYEETTDTHIDSEKQGKSDRKSTTKKKRGYSKKPENKGAGYGDNGKGAGYGN